MKQSPIKHVLTALALSLAALSAAQAQVSVTEPWVRATVPQQKATGAFMQLKAEKGARLVSAQSPAAGIVEIHEMAIVDNVMKMRQIPGLDLPAGKPVELKPGGYHVMLMDLKAPLKEGESVPLTLVFEGADRRQETVEVKAPVRALTTRGGGAPMHMNSFAPTSMEESPIWFWKCGVAPAAMSSSKCLFRGPISISSPPCTNSIPAASRSPMKPRARARPSC